MNIILSRKGFDSQYGKQASPILPDGTLLSLPIPITNDTHHYNQLFYQGKSYLDIIRELRPGTAIDEAATCHLDPDIRRHVKQRSEHWKAIFGQCDAAQGHLRNSGVGVDDIFLFFGWFRQTDEINGRLSYRKGSPDLHIIYGYLQVGEIYRCGDSFPDVAKTHTHASPQYDNKKSNCIYVASDHLSFNKTLNGSGCFAYHPGLVLTKPGMTRRQWQLPGFFKGLKISYHTQHSFKENFFQSVAQGQEFVIEGNENLLQWVRGLIEPDSNGAACR